MPKPTRLVLLFVAGIVIVSWASFEARDWYRARLALELSNAVHAGNLGTIQEFLERGVDPNWETPHGKSSLELATEEDCGACLKLFQDFATEAENP